VLTVRTIWALAQAVKKSDPALSQALLREASVLADAPTTSSAVLADCAQAQMLEAAEQKDPAEASRRQELASNLYRDMLKWHPRAPQKDKALGALAKMALEQNDTQTALDYYARIERDTPWSPLMGDVLLTRARLEVEGDRLDEAVDSYTRLLAVENVSGKLKAQALLALGELEMQRNQPAKAIPYYQRIYILYGKWREAVAKAYLRSGDAFEQINDLEAARKTYEELANSEDLASLPEAESAREKLKTLPAAPEGSS
jgi:tetratricopeptide (TPR) repeat protein